MSKANESIIKRWLSMICKALENFHVIFPRSFPNNQNQEIFPFQ